MVTKKLMHEMQSWLNSLYDFKHPNNIKNITILTSLENFCFDFISIRVAIYSKCYNSLQNLIHSYHKTVRTYSDFETFKQEVNSTIEKDIEEAIEESIYNKLT